MPHSRPSHNPSSDEDAHDPVWEVLGRARAVTPSPDFPRRVLQAVQTAQFARENRWSWLRRVWAPVLRPASAVAILALLVAAAWGLRSLPHSSPAVTTTPGPTVAEPLDESEALVRAIASELALLDHADGLLDPEDGLDLEEADLSHLLF